MKLRLVTTPLVVATLLLGTLGCSKKDDPTTTTTTTGTGSFKRDGVIITGTSQAYLSYFKDLNSQPITDLSVTIIEATSSPSDARSLNIEFQNGTLYAMKYKQGQGNGTSPSTYLNTSSTATVKETSPSAYSGTFSGTGLVISTVNTQTTTPMGYSLMPASRNQVLCLRAHHTCPT